MLTGIISYKYNGQVYKYNALASDTSDTFALYLTSANYEAIQLMAQSDGNDDANALCERRADIKLTKINVETVVTKNQAGKKVKSPVNADLWCKLGAVIRYVKSNCILKNSVGYTGMRSASGVFQANISKDYIIPHPLTHAWIAKVTLLYGNISSIRVETDDFSIDLVNDSSVIRIFSKITDAWSSGFRFNRDYLGFDIPVPVVVSASINGMYNSLDEVIQAHPEKELEYLRDRNYQIVTDDNLEFVCDYIQGYNGLVFFDTETTGLNINFLSRTGDADQCVGVILSVKQGESFYFPLQMKSIPNLCGGDHVYCMERFLKPILEGKELVAHNMSFDWKVAYIYGINVNIRHDTMAILQLTIGNEVKNYSTALKTNVKLLLGRDALELSDLVADNTWGENDIRFWDLPAELVNYYACADTDNTQALFEYLMANNYLGRYNASRVYEIEVDFSLAVAYQEFFGHLVDIRNLEVIREEIGRGQQAEMEAMEAIVGYKFNPSSPSQLTRIMYSELGIPEQRSRKTKNLTTDKETLAKLGELTNEDDEPLYPFVAHLLKYREYEGVRKIIDKFPEHMTEYGYLFSKVMQYGATTGRVTINTPNYQSYNDPIKKNVIPREGYWMFDTDYSSVEYRILGSMVGNKAIIEAFKDPDFDYHTYQAARMNRVPYANVTKKMRKHAKGVNFGLPYGMGDRSLGLRLFGEANDENTRKAFALKQAYFKGQEDIRDWFEAVRDGGVRNGYTETYFGRRRYYRREDFDEPAIRRQAGNHSIQGTAADIYKLAVGRVFRRICKEGWLGDVLLTAFVHDELLGEVANHINPGVFLKALREEFEVVVADDWAPLYMGFGYGMNWYEAKSVELPIKLQWEIVDKYGITGFPNWNGNGREFCDGIPALLRDFEIRDITKQITAEESQGKEIKPALNTQLFDVCKKDSELWTEYLDKYIKEGLTEDKSAYLNRECNIQCFVAGYEPKGKHTTQSALDQFCILHGVDRGMVNLLDIPEVDITQADEVATSGTDFIDFEGDGVDKQKAMDVRVDTLGMYVDTEEKRVILLYPTVAYLRFIESKVNRREDGYSVVFKDTYGLINPNEKGKLYETPAYLASSEIQTIQSLYLQFFNQGGITK